MKKANRITASSHLILVLAGIIIALFIYDIKFSLLKTGIQKDFLWLCIAVTAILYIIWAGYSKIASIALKKDFYALLKKDALTYIPFLFLAFSPLRLFFRIPSNFQRFSILFSFIILTFSASMFIFLKLLFLGIKWEKIKTPKKTIYIITLSYFIIFSALSILKHNSFHSTMFDLGVYDHAMWGYSQFKNLFETSYGMYLLGNHIPSVLFFLVPFYWLYPSPITLLVIQTFALSIAAIPLYLLARKKLNDEKAALIISIAYFAYPSLQYVNLFDFHPIALIIPFLFLGLYLLEIKKYKLAVISLFFAALSMEYSVLLFVLFGVFVFFRHKKRVMGIIMAAAGIAWFYLNFKIIIPYFSGGEYFYLRETFLGSSFSEIFKTILFKPIYIIKNILTLPKLGFLILLFAPMGFGLFAVLSPFILFLLLFDLGIILIWDLSPLSQIVYHHQAPVIPIIVVSTIYGIPIARNIILKILKKFRCKASTKNILFAIMGFIFMASILANIVYGPFTIVYGKKTFFEDKDYVKAGNEIISLIPKNANVSAVNWAGPHLSQREVLFIFPSPIRERNISKKMEEYEKAGAEYFLIDMSDALIEPSRGGNKDNIGFVNMLINDKRYGIISAKNTWVLFQRNSDYEKGVCSITPFLNKEKYPYLDIKISQELLKKCS